MYYCEQCGKECKKKIRYGGYTLCSKHMHQLYKYGRFLDNIQRTNADLNDYIIEGDIVIFNLYNQKNIKIGEFIIDKEDLEKVKYKKWRLSYPNHIVAGQPALQKSLDKKCRNLSHIILDIDPKDDDNLVVGHKNGNGFDNRKANLRICTQSENTLNKSFVSNNTSGFIGIWYDERRETWCPEIHKNRKRRHLGRWRKKEEAVYVRLIAEYILFEEYANEIVQREKEEYTKNIPEERKRELEEYVKNKLSV